MQQKRRQSIVDDFDAIRKRMEELRKNPEQTDVWLRWNLYFRINPDEAHGSSPFWRRFSKDVKCAAGVCLTRGCLRRRECHAANTTYSSSSSG